MTIGPMIGPRPASSTPAMLTKNWSPRIMTRASEVNSSDCVSQVMAAVRIFLTGDPGVGKTTAIRQIMVDLEQRGLRVGGMISGEIRESGRRVGFQLEDVATHKIGVLAHVTERSPGSPAVGSYGVNLSDLESIGSAAIRRAITNADLVVVDEIGPMELKSEEFVLAIKAALESTKHFLGTLHKRSSHPLVSSIRSNSNYRVIEVTHMNREKIPVEVLGELSIS